LREGLQSIKNQKKNKALLSSCSKCKEVLFETDDIVKLEGFGKMYHKLCLKCFRCEKALDSPRILNGETFCEACLAETLLAHQNNEIEVVQGKGVIIASAKLTDEPAPTKIEVIKPAKKQKKNRLSEEKSQVIERKYPDKLLEKPKITNEAPQKNSPKIISSAPNSPKIQKEEEKKNRSRKN